MNTLIKNRLHRLPDPYDHVHYQGRGAVDIFTAGQMRNYAQSAVRKALEDYQAVIESCRTLIESGQRVEAMKTYREATRASLTTA